MKTMKRSDAPANAAQFALNFEAAAEPPRTTPTLADARMLGEAGMLLAEKAAGADFTERAQAYALKYLETVPFSSTELVTDACKAAGIKPRKDDRAFGAVYAGLLRSKQIVAIGDCKRRKGHGTKGGTVVALASKWPAQEQQQEAAAA